MVELADAFTLLHPAIAVVFVLPLIGLITNLAWQTRRRRIEIAVGGKSKIPPVGLEHQRLGRWLTGTVVGLSLIGLSHDPVTSILSDRLWNKQPFQVIFYVLLFLATITSLVFLYQAKTRIWRGIFATLTGMGLVVLGCHPAVFRRTDEWYVSHYYIGIAAAMLMIFSLAILPDIYKDRSNRWRLIHAVLNSIAVLLFIGQGLTGVRDLLETPLSWQTRYVEQLYQQNCKEKNCTIKATPASPQMAPATEMRSER
ncbi:MAG: DUF4079 domain-containing protein [Chroococcidiopsidaceae cyanobacterium CP_BM_ER_R8_30]|nr:DUF4079 domain-containing protein [Chroococcidiopsidaceae cyanobacterium CP_BM_ER_R8_30]